MASAIVLGAGMVGVSTALALQQRGFSVTLLDRQTAGREASYGNAGIIQVEAAEPYALPRDPLRLARFGLGLDNAVNYHLRALPSFAGALWSYFLNSAPAAHRRAASAYAPLTRTATADHAPLIAAAGAEGLIRKSGFLEAQRDERAFAADVERAERMKREYGIAFRPLDGAALAEFEPALTRRLGGAIHWTDSWTCVDPGALTQAYAALFAQRGGRVAIGDAETLAQAGAGWTATTQNGRIEAEHAVVALGAWSAQFLARRGYRVPMIGKRGYHQHFRMARPPGRPIYDVAASVLYCPMSAGLRITSGAELALLDAPKTPVQLQHGLRRAREVLTFGESVEPEPWMGVRPCMPDMLPVIGALPRHERLWANFGHGHQGFTLGPGAANLLAEMMAGGPGAGAAGRAFRPSRLSGL